MKIFPNGLLMFPYCLLLLSNTNYVHFFSGVSLLFYVLLHCCGTRKYLNENQKIGRLTTFTKVIRNGYSVNLLFN